MRPHVDIQMPVRKDGFIVGEVIQRILIQDVDFTFYVDASEDFPFSGDDAEKCVSTELSETSVESWRRAHNEAQTLVAQVADVNEAQTLAKKSFSRGADIQQALLELIAASPRTTGRIQTTIRAAFKRNKMRRLGTSPYVYLADPDVLLPDAPVLGAMVRGLQKHPKLGAVGVCYHPNNHVAAGAMLLRRKDWLRIGQIKGAGASCVCGYIQRRLGELGLYTISLSTLRAVHLKSEYSKVYAGLHSKYAEYEEVKVHDGELDRGELERLVSQYQTRFRLVFLSDE